MILIHRYRKEGRKMMRCGEPNDKWKNLGVDKVVLLEPKDLLEPNTGRIEQYGYANGAVINQGQGEVIVLQLPGSGDMQIAFSVLDLDEALQRLSKRWASVH